MKAERVVVLAAVWVAVVAAVVVYADDGALYVYYGAEAGLAKAAYVARAWPLLVRLRHGA